MRLPATREGRLAVWIVGCGVAVTVFAAGAVRAFIVEVVGPLSLVGGAAVLAGGVLGAVAILRRGERSILVFAAVAFWALVALFVVAEVAHPH